MDSNSIEELLAHWYQAFDKITDDEHILCPKIDDADLENYDDCNDLLDSTLSREEKLKRIENGNARIEATYWTSLIYAYDPAKTGAWLKKYAGRCQDALTSCDKCVMNWHINRKKYLEKFLERWSEHAVEQMSEVLMRHDFIRIDSGLIWAGQIIEGLEADGLEFKKSVLGEKYGEVLLAIFEALCCMPYLSVPGKRQTFQPVFTALQLKKPLRLGGKVLLPAMTTFLFDPVPNRQKFARLAWEQIDTNGLTQEQWDWAVMDHFEAAIKNVALLQTLDWQAFPDIERFWDGFQTMLRTMGEDMILHRLRALEFKPSVYDLLFLHLQCNSEAILVRLISCFCSLLKKSPKAFWGAIGEARSAIIAEQIFVAPLYRPLLNQSSHLGLNDDGEKITIAWVGAFMKSLEKPQLQDACESILSTLLTFCPGPQLDAEGRTACLHAAISCLKVTLHRFLDDDISPETGLLYVNGVLNNTLKHVPILIECLQDPGLKQPALESISAVLQLDANATLEEYKALQGKRRVQQSVFRSPDKIWSAFEPAMVVGSAARLDVIKSITKAMLPLVSIDELRVPRREAKAGARLTPPQVRFNAEFTQTASALANIFDRLCDLRESELADMGQDGDLLRPIFAFPLHGHSAINRAATNLLKAIAGEMSRSDAVTTLMKRHFPEALSAFAYAVNAVMRTPFPWGPMSHIISFCRDFLNCLCDGSDGLLKVRDLSSADIQSVTRWWGSQWRCIEETFNHTEVWSNDIDLITMTTFCRDTIELGEALFSSVGLIASAMTKSDRINGNPMPILLESCQIHLLSFTKMLRLRDEYLVEITHKIVTKLMSRIIDQGMKVDGRAQAYVRQLCIPQPDGKLGVPNKLTDTQKSELLRILGITFEEEQPDILAVLATPTQKGEKQRKQSKLDAWAKSAQRSNDDSASDSSISLAAKAKDDFRDLSSAVDRKKSSLDIIAARMTAKAKPKGPDSAAAVRKSAFLEDRKKALAEQAKKRQEAIALAKAGVKNTGILKSEIMVESSEDESEDDEDEDAQLAAFLQTSADDRKKLDAADQRHRKNLLTLKTSGPVKKQKQIRSAKDMRARINPSMVRLHQDILEWDIFHEGADPPGTTACVKVASSYMTPTEYRDTFYPLLVYEAWRSFVTAKDETTSKPFGIRVATRMNVDSFLELTCLMPSAKYREQGLSEGGILLLSEGEDPLNDPISRHCLARIWRTVFKKDQTETTFRLAHRNNPFGSLIRPGFDMYAVKITNMSTIEREYAALESLQYCELRNEVLEAKPSPLLTFSQQRINATIENYALNDGQSKAVLCAMDNDAFTLVQGPPGTGKTKTIVAMIGALLTGNLKKSSGVAIHPGAPPAQPQGVPKKLLVCAPSNAAVDEIVLRLKQGVKTTDGVTHKINVLRVGRVEAINAANKDVTLEEIIRQRLEGDKTKEQAQAQKNKVHEEAARISREVREIRAQLDDAREKSQQMVIDGLSRQLQTLRKQQADIGAKIDAEKDSGSTIAREVELRKREIQQSVLNQADVLCATLSGSGHEMFRNLNVEFETVIIDEAAQCVELSALIPLKYGCLKCVLVGDPKQLPPTVLSQSAARFGYDQSLFVRMQQNRAQDVHLLDRQYRMHPSISMFPSKEFYESRLLDGGDMGSIRQRPWHAVSMLGPYRFFDVRGSQQKGAKGQSVVNLQEIRVAIELYERFVRQVGDSEARGKIGIITPYKAQLYELRNRFANHYGRTITEEIEFNTTDAFQGRECEIIIFSCVRASPTGGIGFMTDIRRMNVGLTRAKSSLWILGDSRALVQGEFWNKLIVDSQERGLYTTGDISGEVRRSKASNMMPLPLPSADATMTDAPPQSPSTLTIPQRGGQNPPPTGPRNQRSEHTARQRYTPPTIQSSSSSTNHGLPKRPREGGSDDLRTIKRVCFPSQPPLAVSPFSSLPVQNLPFCPSVPCSPPRIHIASGQRAEESGLEVKGLDSMPLNSAEMEELFGETESITDRTYHNKHNSGAQEDLPAAPTPRPFRHTSPGSGGSRTASPASSENEFIDDDDCNDWIDVLNAEPASRVTLSPSGSEEESESEHVHTAQATAQAVVELHYPRPLE